MQYRLHDALRVEDAALRRTKDGYLVGDARVARANNIQLYLGRELGRPDLATVRVFRPENEVFNNDTLHSAAYRPVTVDHPPVGVNANNWKEHSRGNTGGEVARDGDFLRVPLVLMDSAAIDEFEAGKRELSQGYDCEIEWTPGKTADGQEFDAVQRKIRFNHLALVKRARGGSELKLGDAPKEELEMTAATTRTVVVDGISYTMSDQGAELVAKLQKQVGDSATALATSQGETVKANDRAVAAEKLVATKDAEIAALNTKLADATKPEALAAAAAAHAALRDSAKKIAPEVKLEGLGDAAIHKAVVDVKLGDAAAAFTADQYAAAFATLAKDAKTVADAGFRAALGGGKPVGDAAATATRDAAYEARETERKDAWRNEPAATRQ